MRIRRAWSRVATAALFSIVLAVAACGDDDNDNGPAPATTPGTTPAAAGQTYEIVGVDYAFQNVPSSVPVGSVLTFRNNSNVEVHELIAIRIPDEVTHSVQELLQMPDEELDELFPEDEPPAAVLVAMPGEEGVALFGEGVLAQPGRYALLCFIPVGADPEQVRELLENMDEIDEEEGPELEGGPPHAVQGMFAELRVQ